MSDAKFPGSHTTATTVTNTNISVDRRLRFDKSYFGSLGGILKIVHIVLSLLGFICIECAGVMSYTDAGKWYNFVAMFAFWFSLILLGFYVFHVIERTYRIPWILIEFIYLAIWTLNFLIASCIVSTYGVGGFTAAAFFGFCAMVAFGVDTFFKFRAWRNGELAQGEQTITRQQTTTSDVRSPAY